MTRSHETGPSDERAARRAKALRENLKRRKAAARKADRDPGPAVATPEKSRD